MSVLRAEVLEAFRSIGVPEDNAIKAATALSSLPSTVEAATTTSFLRRDAVIDAIRNDVATLKVDTAVLKWMNGVLLTMVTAILFKLFLH
jgi:transketolase C-terminal domain/subunit